MTGGARANAIRWGALTIGVLLFAAALYYINLTLTLDTIHRLGAAIPLALLLSGLWHLVRTWAWAWCFPQPRQVSFLRLARVRLAWPDWTTFSSKMRTSRAWRISAQCNVPGQPWRARGDGFLNGRYTNHHQSAVRTL